MSSNPEKYLDAIREKLTGSTSRARTAWNKLKPTARKAILLLADRSEHLSSVDWDNLPDADRQALYLAVRRLRYLYDEFKTCRPKDFSCSSANSAPVFTNVRPAKNLQAKATLVNSLKH